MLIAFDTSAAHCAVALLHGDAVLAQRLEPMAKGQAERLMPLVTETLAEAGVDWPAVRALAVGTGPGNFTGIRLSVAAARGLALSRGIKAIGVSMLEALAHNGPRPMLACLDARRGAFYVQRFDTARAWEPRLIDDPALIPEGLPRRGSGPGAEEVPGNPAIAIGRVAQSRVGLPAPRPAPLYIRPADAAPARDAAPRLLP